MVEDPALIVVDLQNDFCKPAYSHRDVSHFQPALERIGTFLETYRKSGRTPLFVRTIHDEYTSSQRREEIREEKYEDKKPTVCYPGTKGVELVPEVKDKEPEIVITKHEYSGFHNTALNTYLTNNAISNVIVVGVNTNVCVAATVFDAYHHGYSVTVLSDCVASHERGQHEHTLQNIDAHFGTIIESKDYELPSKQ